MDIRHEDLVDNLFKNTAEIAGNGVDDDGNGYIDDVNGWDAVTDTGNMRDQDSHGTHVSGIVGARGNNGKGGSGVNWRVKLLPLRFIEVRSGSTFDAIQCIDYAVRLRQEGVNIRVLNNSWGGGGFSSALYDAIVRANTAGILFVCAAGNDGLDTDVVSNFPSCYEVPNVISVGAMTRQNFQAGFSNYGKRTVDVFAPGDDILSSTPNNSYSSFSGTSQASPHVAGIAGLILAVHPDASVAAMKAMLLGSATPERFAENICLTGARVSAVDAVKSDGSPPAALADFHLTNVTRSTIAVAWTAVGDDGTSGRSSYYDIRWSNAPITTSNFELATQLNDTRVPERAGTAELAQLRGCFADGSTVYVAMRAYDDGGNFTQSATLVASPTGNLSTFDVVPGAVDDFTLGEPLNLKGDDKAAAVELPFAFPFYGAEYRTIYVSTNGLVSFDGPITTAAGTRSDLEAQSVIAPMWFDLTTDGTLPNREDVYVDSSASRVSIRWIAEPFFERGSVPKDIRPVSFAVTLYPDGRVDFNYGPGGNEGLRNASGTPLVGISDGGCVADTFDGYSGKESLANAPPISLRPGTLDDSNKPTISAAVPSIATEGTPVQFAVTSTSPNDGPVTLSASLPRNATFDAATGTVRFTPDSAQDGPVQFLFASIDSTGQMAHRIYVLNVTNNGNLPEVSYTTLKSKVTFNGIGFRVGSKVEIDGHDVGDAKNSKKAPATKITSVNAKSALAVNALHTVIVVSPDGTRSGPFYSFP